MFTAYLPNNPDKAMSVEHHIPLKQVQDDDLALAEVSELDLYQRREKIYTRKMEGVFQKIRLFTGWPLLLGYFLLPWLMWDGHQAILFDLPERKFYIFFLTFWPQDFPLLAWIMIIGAFALFAITNFAGRIWCGYTCPQTVWTAIYMWCEQKTEGSRSQRIKLDKAPWTLSKFSKKFLKHSLWFGFAFLTGFTFIAYFTPVYELTANLFTGTATLMVLAWILFFTIATYINAGWLREQVCMHMCPYARFQSVMFDSDTLIVSYDAKRGDPRGSRKKTVSKEDHALGDCIDCHICVQVCPTGIDIRDGLQYQCIGCALCIDACDSVMDKMDYPRGLIRYTTENILNGGQTNILRPRLIGYCAVLVIMIIIFASQMWTRSTLELDIMRDRQQLFTQTGNGLIENTYTLKIINKTDEAGWFFVEVAGIEDVSFSHSTRFFVEASTTTEEVFRLSTAPNNLNSPITEIEFRVSSEENPKLQDTEDSRFIGPNKS